MCVNMGFEFMYFMVLDTKVLRIVMMVDDATIFLVALSASSLS